MLVVANGWDSQGLKYGDERIQAFKEKSVLKREVSLPHGLPWSGEVVREAQAC